MMGEDDFIVLLLLLLVVNKNIFNLNREVNNSNTNNRRFYKKLKSGFKFFWLIMSFIFCFFILLKCLQIILADF